MCASAVLDSLPTTGSKKSNQCLPDLQALSCYSCWADYGFIPPKPCKSFSAMGSHMLGLWANFNKAVSHEIQMSQKTWIAVFICHSTKALHLEIVENLSSSQFIAAFERFGSRRGYPVHMYSDNASTFKSASRIIAEANRFVLPARNLEVITKFLSVQGTSWHFCRTYSPHRNSLAEACIKSLKFHLRRPLGQQVVPLLTLYTLFAKIEACLNSG